MFRPSTSISSDDDETGATIVKTRLNMDRGDNQKYREQEFSLHVSDRRYPLVTKGYVPAPKEVRFLLLNFNFTLNAIEAFRNVLESQGKSISTYEAIRSLGEGFVAASGDLRKMTWSVSAGLKEEEWPDLLPDIPSDAQRTESHEVILCPPDFF